MKEIYYHGTSFDSLNSIIESRFVGVDYFDGFGVYLTQDIENAFNHGEYVLCFENINKDNLTTDDVNDGLLHNGVIPIKFVKSILINTNYYQSLYIKNIINAALIDIKNENTCN